ncbi:MAG: hypothetical protein IMW90_08525 [Thermogemmatispora sp.]|uniref:hypothetical protein n=1 Tax=Thermogemmatispora sp. TaxID=1968838 RepID=UPI0019E14638|nr:hypothetical protein [Thermogemmatispora sp.]MBE3565756.1 hypothetical protein [Thermogemmatispora sp.]
MRATFFNALAGSLTMNQRKEEWAACVHRLSSPWRRLACPVPHLPLPWAVDVLLPGQARAC